MRLIGFKIVTCTGLKKFFNRIYDWFSDKVFHNRKSKLALPNISTRVLFDFMHNKVAVVSALFLIMAATFSIFIPIFSSYNYFAQDLNNTLLPPLSKGHIFGTDVFGRDVLIRVCEGGRISLLIGVSAAVLQSFIGVIYGGLAGSFGGWIDEIMMRIADMVYSIPGLLLAIILAALTGRNMITLILVLSVADWTVMARVVRVQALRLKESEYVQVARILGSGKMRILRKHILPNSYGPIMVNMLFSIPAAIFGEGFLSFIGLGVQIPKASWGSLVNDGYRYVFSYPWLMMIPLFFIAATILAFNVVGDAIAGRNG